MFVYEILIPALCAFAITAVLGHFLIPVLKRMKMDQTERAEGVKSHLDKAGTPTMGGLMFLAGFAVVTIACSVKYPKICPIMILTLGFGLLGFIDDFLKVVKRKSDGLLWWQKLIIEIIIIVGFFVYIKLGTDVSLAFMIPFAGGREADAGILTYPLLVFAIAGTVNGANFTDGVDGLGGSVTAVIALFLTIVSATLGAGVASAGAAVFGALCAFLIFNANPARVFMGDTGSLALGGFVASMAIVMKLPIFLLIFAVIYVIEVLSVILQVGFFKLTHGRRIFKMAPIHHHFELSGYSESQVVMMFTVATALACMIAYAAML